VEARRCAQGYQNPGHTLDATALVHEAYLRLVGDQHFDGLGHFFAAAEAMRRILVDAASPGEAADRLVELYTATNQSDEAKKWRAERAKYPNVDPPPRAKK
jgi:hypothetical protein